MKVNNVLELIGNTPHLRLNKIFGNSHEVWIKLERQNPGASIKDRIGLAMIEDANAGARHCRKIYLLKRCFHFWANEPHSECSEPYPRPQVNAVLFRLLPAFF